MVKVYSGSSGVKGNGDKWFNIGCTVRADSEEVPTLKAAVEEINAKFKGTKYASGSTADFVRALLQFALDAELPEED